MYNFASAAQRDAFRSALADGATHHIRAVIVPVDESPFTDFTIVDRPNIDSRCVENEEVFDIAGMYVGELDLRIKNSNMRTAALIGGEIELYFSVDVAESDPIEIPLGVWDIIDAKRDSEHFINILGYDHMQRLATPLDIPDVGVVYLSTIMAKISQYAQVTFEQTAPEILNMAIKDEISISGGHDPLFNVFGWCTHYEKTCWDEVRIIAYLIGGFAFANRKGNIEFRKFERPTNLTIPAEKRFYTKLSEQNYNVGGATYVRDNGKSYTHTYSAGTESLSIIQIPQNKYIFVADNNDENYQRIAEMYNLKLIFPEAKIYPGTFDFYGDPSLDLGDEVRLQGGIADNRSGSLSPIDFIICANYWQFRGPQTLTCGGAPLVGQRIKGYKKTNENDYIYIVANNEAKLLIYIGPYTRIITPETMDGAPVTAISNSCFMGTDVEAVNISSGIITIE